MGYIVGLINSVEIVFDMRMKGPGFNPQPGKT